MAPYARGATIYVKGEERRVDEYEESVDFYRVYDPKEEKGNGYYTTAPRTLVRAEDVHGLSYDERLRRIEERLGLD